VLYDASLPRYLRPTPALTKLFKFLKKILHLWKFPVISKLRTNFAEMPGKSQQPGSREQYILFGYTETRW
jgi:hypothetical protein